MPIKPHHPESMRKPFRLYNCFTRKFLGPVETRTEAWKRLSSWTQRRRNGSANWMRLCVQPLEVMANNHEVLMPDYAAFAEERYRSLHGMASANA